MGLNVYIAPSRGRCAVYNDYSYDAHNYNADHNDGCYDDVSAHEKSQ